MSGMTRRDVSTAQLMKTHGYSARTDYHKDKQDAQAVRELAREILRLTRSTLLIHMRFLESALVRFVPGDETVTPEMATDGKFLYYNSIHICRLFKTSPQLVCRDYMHLTLHCIFRHLFVGEKLNGELWDLACDIAVEHLITGLGIKSLYAERQEKQSWLTDKLKEQMPRLTAERIYRYLVEQDLPPQEIGRIREYFYADDHRIWHRQPEAGSGGDRGESRDKTQNGADSASELGDMSGEDEFTPPEDGESEERRASGGSDTGERRDSGDNEGMTWQANENPGDRPAMTPQETEQMWKKISERIRVDLDTSANSYGENTGDFVSAIGEVNREKIDYAAFLRRFAVLGENMQINDDEFDYIFYTYGMKLYSPTERYICLTPSRAFAPPMWISKGKTATPQRASATFRKRQRTLWIKSSCTESVRFSTRASFRPHSADAKNGALPSSRSMPISMRRRPRLCRCSGSSFRRAER